MRALRLHKAASTTTTILAAALLWSLFFIKPAVAIADPTSISIESIAAYDSVLESRDLLIIVEYDLVYSSTPTEVISDAFLGRFLVGTTEFKSVEPFPFNDKGYGPGIFSLYWTAIEKTADSIEFDNPNLEDYKITFQGKPGVFTGTVPTITSTGIAWRDTSDTLGLLFTDIETFAYGFENDPAWNDDPDFDDLIFTPGGVVQLTSEGPGSGEEYFSNAVNRLASMIPGIFSTSTSAPDFSEAIPNVEYEETVNTFWDNNWVNDHFIAQADIFDVPKGVVTSFIAVFFMGVIAFACANLLGQNAEAGGFGMLTMAATLPLFGAVNLIPLNFVIAVAFIFGVVGTGWVFFLRRAA